MNVRIHRIEGEPLTSRSGFLLARIADGLGCPPEAFSGKRTGIAELDDLHELLELWSALPDQPARRRALEALRAALS